MKTAPALTTPCHDISHRFSNDNLHINLQQHFEAPQAAALLDLCTRYHQSCKKIFVDVRLVEKTHPGAVAAFRDASRKAPYSPQQIIFKGNSGFELAVNGNRVIVNSRKTTAPVRQKHTHEHHGKGHVCCGKCANCRCGSKKAG